MMLTSDTYDALRFILVGQSVKDTAERLGCSPTTVKRRLHRLYGAMPELRQSVTAVRKLHRIWHAA